MIKFYTNKELSKALGLNLARWKRWSREFLPPDPLGGLQSGYARQYNLDEAFTVYLGGHLVADLKFTIPESRRILEDLKQWMLDHGFYFDFSGMANVGKKTLDPIQSYHIAVIPRKSTHPKDSSLYYRIKATIAAEALSIEGRRMFQERFFEAIIGMEDGSAQEDLNSGSYRILNLSGLRQRFLNCLQSDPDKP